MDWLSSFKLAHLVVPRCCEDLLALKIRLVEQGVGFDRCGMLRGPASDRPSSPSQRAPPDLDTAKRVEAVGRLGQIESKPSSCACQRLSQINRCQHQRASSMLSPRSSPSALTQWTASRGRSEPVRPSTRRRHFQPYIREATSGWRRSALERNRAFTFRSPCQPGEPVNPHHRI